MMCEYENYGGGGKGWRKKEGLIFEEAREEK
jgi:hypothetical protein